MKLISKIKSIPSSLQTLTIILWIIGSGLIISSLVLGWKDTSTGATISQRELWSRLDGGIAIFLTGCALVFIGYAIYRGWSWIRHALMIGVVIIAFSGFFDEDFTISYWIVGTVALIAIILGIRYFYFRHEVITFFQSNQNGMNTLINTPKKLNIKMD